PKQHFNYLANPTVDEKCRKHPNKERYAFAKKSSLNKSFQMRTYQLKNSNQLWLNNLH
ncbi:Uncharacterized protein APZ42_006481, partial [Daphnia magna]